MDSFFVEVERREDPALRGRPVAVGGTGPRGVIASASYEARTFGVRSAQPTSTALRQCPSLIVVPPSHGRYSDVSSEVFRIFRDFTPLVEGLSLDEAFLDVSGLRHHYESPVDVGHSVRSRIRNDLGLPASVGIAATKFVAKLASEAAKPDGIRHVPAADQLDFLHSLPAEALWGVGPATLAALERLGVESVGDLAELPQSSLSVSVGPTMGRHLHDLAHGVDPRRVEPDSEAKSISVEETYVSDLEGSEVLEAALLAHAHRLSGRLRRAGLAARTITLKLRYEDFTTLSRSHTVAGPIDGARDLYREALELLSHLEVAGPVRLLGLGGSTLTGSDQPRQLGIEASESWERVEDAVADVRDRYGEGAVAPARLLEEWKEPG
jgi:DNA polymerase-4